MPHTARPELDRDVPVLMVRVGHYPYSHSPIGAVRSFGRLGVPVHAMVEGRWTATATSHYLTGVHVRPTTGREPAAELIETIRSVAHSIGRPAVAVCTDDESACLLAEHAAELAPDLLLPPVPADLPRRLADKGGLYQVCRANDVPSPRSATPATMDELLDAARELGYPLVLKNLAPFSRLDHPLVSHTTVIHDEADLRALDRGPAQPAVLAQEFLPPEHCEDWFTHLVCGPCGVPLLVFTGRKERDWPPGGGFTTLAHSLPNPELAALATDLCRRIGYSGIADLDWRYDRRDGRYKLVDFNPRQGAQFRLFETTGGIDVVRALHLWLTGRPVPDGPQLVRRFRVGRLDLLSAAAHAWQDRRPPRYLLPTRGTVRAWACHDDPVPLLYELARTAGTATTRTAGRLTGHFARAR
ncbi:ATP-grasp domain-containing protein [Streptomyces sp. TLI_171]|uniref:carboxylate--amine ligase n=1 Tax=Streptomyces sp. TLI_171 TaxID=1938859 RepID=UPI000C506438|nr:ATP-grasp domain-containing protein [Streptomyces sp. TLI_171]RKE22623.1 putative ATP-grasp superfamily ATP-dependent carboligase [Streptomyces sp. TLI_171]